ncbi:hypothetical protein R3P38DRAFT_3236540 [Favolaschia claudopus]|uniref:Uncharacterized protein n=1 Tax=Favolaschia claudopus TaxID=2862362 RepID=A0AAV9ZCU5_9AGAR
MYCLQMQDFALLVDSGNYVGKEQNKGDEESKQKADSKREDQDNEEDSAHPFGRNVLQWAVQRAAFPVVSVEARPPEDGVIAVCVSPRACAHLPDPSPTKSSVTVQTDRLND